MRTTLDKDTTDYGCETSVFCESDGHEDRDTLKITIDFSKSSFKDGIKINVIGNTLEIHTTGSIEKGEITSAFENVLASLKTL